MLWDGTWYPGWPVFLKDHINWLFLFQVLPPLWCFTRLRLSFMLFSRDSHHFLYCLKKPSNEISNIILSRLTVCCLVPWMIVIYHNKLLNPFQGVFNYHHFYVSHKFSPCFHLVGYTLWNSKFWEYLDPGLQHLLFGVNLPFLLWFYLLICFEIFYIYVGLCILPYDMYDLKERPMVLCLMVLL